MFRTLEGRPPKRVLPAGTVDCHIHLYDQINFPSPAEGPPHPVDALISHYEKVQKWLGINRVILVQGNASYRDNSCILNALEHFGEHARAVVAVGPDISNNTLEKMTGQGVRGARIMNILQGAVGLSEMLAVNQRVQPFGWHLIVQFDGRDMVEHQPDLEKIEGDYVIDHTGKFLEPVAPDSPAFNSLLKLVDRGNCYVKIAGCYETSKSGYPDYDDVGVLARTLIQHAPERIIWGSNWPHNMSDKKENYPDDVHLLDLVSDWAGSDPVRQQIFVDNPSRLYGF